MKETNKFVVRKLGELEKCINNLSCKHKHAYYISLQQEIIQKTSYVKSKKHLLTFLRAEKFDASKAALRLTSFYTCKLELFGPALLSRRIAQIDLNESDQIILKSGFLYVGAKDYKGRPVIFVDFYRLMHLDLLNDHFKNNIMRVAFYLLMFVMENDVRSQKKGCVFVRWKLSTFDALKSSKWFFPSLASMVQSLPLKYVEGHHCCSSPAEFSFVSWFHSMMQVVKIEKTSYIVHEATASEHFFGLSKYGIRVEALPVTSGGDFDEECYISWLGLIRQQELFDFFEQIESVEQIVSEEIRSFFYDEASNDDLCQVTKNRNNLNSGTTLQQQNATSEMAIDNEKKQVLALDELGPQHHDPQQLEKAIGYDVVLPAIDDDGEFAKMTKNEIGNTSKVEFKTTERVESSVFIPETAFQQFAFKLMSLLNQDKYPDSMWWSDGGNSFTIDKKSFSKKVMPTEFKANILTSFLRRLNRWQFKRLPCTARNGSTSSSSSCIRLQHKLFKKDSPELLDNCAVQQNELHAKEKCPETLLKIINNDFTADCIWWILDGRAIAIDQEKISKEVLQNNFGNIKLGSFYRSLHRWGFRRLFDQEELTPENVMVFHHDLFQKGAKLPPLLKKFWCPRKTMK